VREETLKRFFQGEATALDLAKDVAGSTKRLSSIADRVDIEDMDTDFCVIRPMLVSLVDAVLAGSLPPDALATIGFALDASDKFIWDGDDADELLANVIADWSCPEVNFPLTLENVAKFRARLAGDEHYPTRPKEGATHGGRLISIKQKKSIERHRRRQRST
jgi:hypothetical protein